MGSSVHINLNMAEIGMCYCAMLCPLHLLEKARASSQKTNNIFVECYYILIYDMEGWNEKMQRWGGPWTHSHELAEI